MEIVPGLPMELQVIIIIVYYGVRTDLIGLTHLAPSLHLVSLKI